MKKVICSVFLALSTVVVADEISTSGYVDFHALGGYPMVGIGLRSKEGMHGFDFSGHILPYVPELRLPELGHTTFHIRGLYLFYPNEKGLYLGTGLGMVNARENLEKMSGTFEGTFGYQWKTSDRTMLFLEANVIAPFETPVGARVWPGLTLGFGF